MPLYRIRSSSCHMHKLVSQPLMLRVGKHRMQRWQGAHKGGTVQGGDVASGVRTQQRLGFGAPGVRRRHQARRQRPAVAPVHVRTRRKRPQR